MSSRPRVRVPDTAKAGEIILIRALLSHPMESGQRRDSSGTIIPRKIVNSFTCTFNGEPVFSCDLEPAISANPYFEFHAKIVKNGEFEFAWTDDDGTIYTHKHTIEVV